MKKRKLSLSDKISPIGDIKFSDAVVSDSKTFAIITYCVNDQQQDTALLFDTWRGKFVDVVRFSGPDKQRVEEKLTELLSAND